ncbi:MAG: hypothetical protein ACK5CU_04440 [Rhodoluna sp.]|jgi:heme/copper-type cytochrome/quinol oxidase subunit 1
MICNNCNNSITRQDVTCPHCQITTGVGAIALQNLSYVLGSIGAIMGFGPLIYWTMLINGSVAIPTSDWGDGVNLFLTGIAVTIIGSLIGVAGLIMLIIAISQKRYRKAR